MKLDKFRFAILIGFISYRYALTIIQNDIMEIDDIIDIDLPEGERIYPLAGDVDNLMYLMAQGTQKIEAIKLHRKLTGYGLRESKEAVEKYWVSKPVEAATIGDILDKSTNNY